MSRLCKWFGHRPVDGYKGQPPYFSKKGGVVDGTGVEHVRLWVECQRCGTNYHVGNFHIFPEDRSPKPVDQ